MTQNLITSVFRKEVLKLSAYKVAEAKNLIKLDAMENPYTWPDDIKQQWLKAIKDCPINRYPDPEAKQLAQTIKQTNEIPDQSEILLGNGSDEILMWPSLCLIGDGDNAVTGQNTFSEYTFSTLVTNGEIRKAPLTNGKFNKNEILKLTDDKTKIVYICNPNNPTGTYLPKDEILDIIESIPKDKLVIVDEAYGEYGDEDFYSC